MVSVNQIRSFIMLAEIANYSQAAEALNIAQTTLTKRIQQLETNLECRLFDRSTRRVNLTSAGEVLYRCWAQSLHMYDIGLQDLASHLKDDLPQIYIGMNSISMRSSGETYMSEFYRRTRDFTLTYSTVHSHGQIDSVRDGRLDAGFIIKPRNFEKKNPDIGFIETHRTPVKALCSTSSPLANEEVITLKMLSDERHVSGIRTFYRHYIDEVNQHFTERSLEWNIVEEHLHTDGILNAVLVNELVAIIPFENPKLLPSGIVAKPIQDVKIEIPTIFIWNKKSRRPSTLEAVSLAKQLWTT